MWKDFFYYSKSERRSILILTGMGILLLASGTYSHWTHQTELPRVDSLCVDSFFVRVYQKHSPKDTFSKSARVARPAPILSYFDPNKADSAELYRLGLPPFLAQRIVRYREKGGVFRKAEDFARIYGLSEKQYQSLKPYIVIDEVLSQQKGLSGAGSMVLADSHQVDVKGERSLGRMPAFVSRQDSTLSKYPEGTVVDLNRADTVQLKKIPGIGSGLSKMIVAYRNRLGGYASVEQLQEIGYVDSSLHKWFKVESGVYRPIKVNHASLDRLRNHPYMNFYKAKVILEYRRKRGKIKGLSQLSMFQEFTEKDLQKLKPYLDFE